MINGNGARGIHCVLATFLIGCPGATPGADEGATDGPGTTADPPTAGDTADVSATGTTADPPATTEDPPDPTSSTTVDPPGDTTVDPPGDTTSDPPGTTTVDDTTGTTDDPPVGEWTERDKARVFVSGHSLTDNPLVDYLVLLADSQGRDFDYNQQIGIGSPIRGRTKGLDWNAPDWPGYHDGKNKQGQDMDIIAEFLDPQTIGAGERYDTLVITERHDVLGTIQWEDTTGLLRHYHDRLIDGNPDAETLLYHSWLDIDKAAPQPWIDHEKLALVAWECVASKVNHTLEADGRPDRIKTLPVGAALVDLVERVLAGEVANVDGDTSQRLDQLFADNVHLTHTGVYFAALVTHAAVFRASPVGAAAPADVDVATAADLQQIAWDFVRDYYTTENIGVRTMESCRESIATEVCGTYWTLQNNPGNIAGCQNHFNTLDPNNGQNPFQWPHPDLVPWPAP
jgi:hypothetical protein